MKLFYLIGVSMFVLSSCRPSLEVPEPTPGVLALGQYVAIGDGYTAGISNVKLNDSLGNTGWYNMAQTYSFPALLAEQFSLALDYPFTQPPLSPTGSGHLFIESMSEPICDFEESTPVIWFEEADPSWNQPSVSSIPDNVGFPGLTIEAVDEPIFTSLTPQWKLLGGNDQQTYRSLISQARPGFFSIFLGLEDVLSFAISGGENDTRLPKNEVAFHLEGLLETALAVPGSYGVIGNLPDPTNFPYFTRIQNQFQNIEDCKESSLPIFITNQSGSISTAKKTDRILLPAGSLLGTDAIGNGPFGLISTNPVPSRWVMDEGDLFELRSQVEILNSVIDSLVTQINSSAGFQRLAIVDLNTSFELLESGILEDGLTLSTEYLSGGIFSLDGLYLTPRGNAWLANQFITTINQVSEFGAKIPPLNITSYPGIRYP